MKKEKMYKIELKVKGKGTPSYLRTIAPSAKEALQKARDFYKLAPNTKVLRLVEIKKRKTWGM